MTSQYLIDGTLKMWEEWEQWVQPNAFDGTLFLTTEAIEALIAIGFHPEHTNLLTPTEISIIAFLAAVRRVIEQVLRDKAYVRNNDKADYGANSLGVHANVEDVVNAVLHALDNLDLTAPETAASEIGDANLMTHVIARTLGVDITEIVNEKLEIMHQKRKQRALKFIEPNPRHKEV